MQSCRILNECRLPVCWLWLCAALVKHTDRSCTHSTESSRGITGTHAHNTTHSHPGNTAVLYLWVGIRSRGAWQSGFTPCALLLAVGYTPTWGPEAVCRRPEASRVKQNKKESENTGRGLQDLCRNRHHHTLLEGHEWLFLHQCIHCFLVNSWI